MICDVCGREGAKIRHVTRSYGRGKNAFLIEGVPLVMCPECVESYLTAETLQAIERICMHWRHLAFKRRVLVAKFGMTA